jgi:hypothetical protein
VRRRQALSRTRHATPGCVSLGALRPRAWLFATQRRWTGRQVVCVPLRAETHQRRLLRRLVPVDHGRHIAPWAAFPHSRLSASRGAKLLHAATLALQGTRASSPVAMPVLEGTAPYTGGESWQLKFSESAVTPEDTAAPYPAWHRTWHLHPGLAATGQFETTAPVPSSVLLARPWDAPVLRTEAASGPLGWRAGLEGVTSVSDEPWPFEVDARNGKLKCLACCASASGECNLDTCALKPPPLSQQFLDASRPGEDLRDPALVAAHVAYAQEQAKLAGKRCESVGG